MPCICTTTPRKEQVGVPICPEHLQEDDDTAQQERELMPPPETPVAAARKLQAFATPVGDQGAGRTRPSICDTISRHKGSPREIEDIATTAENSTADNSPTSPKLASSPSRASKCWTTRDLTDDMTRGRSPPGATAVAVDTITREDTEPASGEIGQGIIVHPTTAQTAAPHEAWLTTTTELVHRFGPDVATYASLYHDVRLHVREGSLQEGQAAGPINLGREPRLVKCNVEEEGTDQYYITSSTVSCFPSGRKFGVPLDLDFCVSREGGVEESKKDIEARIGDLGIEGSFSDSDDSFDAALEGETDEHPGCGDGGREEYLRSAYKVMCRQQEDQGGWHPLDDEDIELITERCSLPATTTGCTHPNLDTLCFFLRAKVPHFSDWTVAKRVSMDDPYDDEIVSSPWGIPGKREVAFLNATDVPVTFVVLPTTWGHNYIKSLSAALKIPAGIALSGDMERVVRQTILHGATDPQVIQLKAKKAEEERCPHQRCFLPKCTGTDVRVALITFGEVTVKVWDYRIVKQRTRVTVLPGKFGDGMKPSLGEHRFTEQEIAEQPGDIALETLLKVLAGQKDRQRPPAEISTEPSSASSSGVDSSASSETDI